MKLLVIADRPPKQNILKTLQEQKIDLICTLGDLEMHQIQELERVTDIPKIGVYGNHCSGLYMEELGIKNMHLAAFDFGGLTFGGFEGSVRYKPSSYAKMYTQEGAAELLRDFPRVDVMLVHCPPYGINDEPAELAHQGFKALRDYVEMRSPAYLLHGHTYPAAENHVTQYIKTRIIYVSGGEIVNLASP